MTNCVKQYIYLKESDFQHCFCFVKNKRVNIICYAEVCKYTCVHLNTRVKLMVMVGVDM